MFNITHQNIGIIPCHIFWKDKHSKFLGCNASFAKLAGLNSEIEIVNKTDFDMPWSSTNAKKYQKDDAIVIQGFQKLSYLENQRQADGQIKQIITSKSPLLNSKNEIIGVMGVFQEIPLCNNQPIFSFEKKNKIHENEYLQFYTLLQNISQKRKLTKRELECLSLWVYGFSIKETANHFKVSNRTIIGYRASIKYKLNFNRSSQLIELLYRSELFMFLIHFAQIVLHKYNR